MKKTIFSIILLCLATINFSCTIDETPLSRKDIITARPQTMNSLNPYEDIGITSYNLFHLYINSSGKSSNLEDISKDVSDLMVQQTTLNHPTIHLNESFIPLIESILDNPLDKLQDLLSLNKISTYAHEKILDLAEIITDDSKPIKSEMSDNIIAYEMSVLTDGNLLANEKEVLLLNAAFLRYSLYDSGGDDDKDWDLSVGKFIISIYGSVSSIEDALLMNLVSRIYLSY